MTRVFLLLLAASAGLLTLPLSLSADGGVLLLHAESGAFAISIFGTPAPLRAGPADLSVLVQNKAGQDVLLDADLTLRLSRTGQPDITLKPTRQQAANKYLYASQFTFPAAGKWKLELSCKEGKQTTNVNGELTVSPAEPALFTYWGYFLFVPLTISLFILNQWLKQNRRVRPSQRSGH